MARATVNNVKHVETRRNTSKYRRGRATWSERDKGQHTTEAEGHRREWAKNFTRNVYVRFSPAILVLCRISLPLVLHDILGERCL